MENISTSQTDYHTEAKERREADWSSKKNISRFSCDDQGQCSFTNIQTYGKQIAGPTNFFSKSIQLDAYRIKHQV